MIASITLHPASAARLSDKERFWWSHALQGQGLVVRPAHIKGQATLTAWPRKPARGQCRAVWPGDNPPPSAA